DRVFRRALQHSRGRERALAGRFVTRTSPPGRRQSGRRGDPAAVAGRAGKTVTSPMRRALVAFLITTAAAAALLLALAYKIKRYPDTATGSASGVIELEIPKGAGAQQVADMLAGAGLLERPTLFRLYAGQRGVASRFKAGHYKVTAPATPRQLIDLMVRGV